MESKRSKDHLPWQGILLGILGSLGILSLVFILGSLFMAKGLITPYLEETPFALLLGAGSLAVILILTFGIAICISIVYGVFKGQIWAIIILLLFTGMNLLGALFSVSVMAIFSYIFLLYCEIVCVRHPFYNS